MRLLNVFVKFRDEESLNDSILKIKTNEQSSVGWTPEFIDKYI